MQIRKSQTVPQTRPAGPPVSLQRRRSFAWLFVLMAAFAAVGWWGWDRFVRVAGHGIVQVDHLIVTSPLDGRIEAMHVKLFGEYDADGPVFSIVDQEALDEMEVLRLELEVLESRQNEKRLEVKIADDVRLEADAYRKDYLRGLMEDARRELKLVQANLGSAEAELPAALHELDRLQRLAPEGNSTTQEVVDARARVRSFDAQISKLKGAVVAAQAEVDGLQAAVSESPPARQDIAGLVEPLMREAEVIREKMEQLQDRLERRVITAPNAGVVTKVHRRAGGFVLAGDTVVELGMPDTLRVVAYFDQRFRSKLGEGMAVTITSTYTDEIAGVIRRIMPEMETLPPPLASAQPDGAVLLPVEVEVDEHGLRKLVPGSVVRVMPAKQS